MIYLTSIAPLLQSLAISMASVFAMAIFILFILWMDLGEVSETYKEWFVRCVWLLVVFVLLSVIIPNKKTVDEIKKYYETEELKKTAVDNGVHGEIENNESKGDLNEKH